MTAEQIGRAVGHARRGADEGRAGFESRGIRPYPATAPLRAAQFPPASSTAIGLDRITFNPRMMGGKACIRGMRLTVSLIVNLVASGMTPAEIIVEYPELEPADIQQAMAYAAWLAEESVHPLEIRAE